MVCLYIPQFFSFNDTPTTEIYTLSLHDALPISNPGSRDQGPALSRRRGGGRRGLRRVPLVPRKHPCAGRARGLRRSEEHTSELQSLRHLVCRLLLEKKNYRTWLTTTKRHTIYRA